jgi:hypothetical protein
MERRFGHTRDWTVFVEDRKEGFAGYRLHAESFGKTYIAADVVYWDARGQYFVRTINQDVPVEIIEDVIAEAKQRIAVK